MMVMKLLLMLLSLLLYGCCCCMNAAATAVLHTAVAIAVNDGDYEVIMLLLMFYHV